MPESEAPTVGEVLVSVSLLRVKIVQSNKLAVALGVVLCNGSSESQGCLGFKKEEPCHVFLRTHSDVTRLEKYLQAHDRDGNAKDKDRQAVFVTRPWCNLSKSGGSHICCLRTVLTKAIERNRHGVKLIECQELLSIHHGSSHSNSNPQESSETPNNPKDLQRFKMHDKSERHALFAQWLVDNFGRDFLVTGSGVLDVAGGKGELSHALWVLGIPSMVLDPAPRLVGPHCQDIPVLAFALEGAGTNLLKESKHATTTMQERILIRTCSMIVGMHPDQATEPIIRLAKHLGVPFALLPCCVMPSLFPDRVHHGQPVRSYRVFCQYLQALASNESKAETLVHADHLPFMGRNMILYSNNQ